MKEALFYEKAEKSAVKCVLCPRFCKIAEGKLGFCNVRENREGKLYSLYYGKPCSVGIDPIEKKPLYHFAPGSRALSIATVGCNLACSFCQNWTISHPESAVHSEDIAPEKVIELAKANGAQGISYTYTEPTIFFEYALDTMKLARKAGLYNMWVSNGYTNPEPAKMVAKYMDAINVDLKGDVNFYQNLCSVPDEEPMHQALKIYQNAGVWIEITNLIIPSFNDRPEQIKDLVEWVRDNLGPETPIHFSMFYPQYKLKDTEPTPVKTLEKALEIAKKAGIEYAYLGNVPGHEAESTYCPKCGSVVIKRSGYDVDIKESCDKCNNKIKIEGMKWSG